MAEYQDFLTALHATRRSQTARVVVNVELGSPPQRSRSVQLTFRSGPMWRLDSADGSVGFDGSLWWDDRATVRRGGRTGLDPVRELLLSLPTSPANVVGADLSHVVRQARGGREAWRAAGSATSASPIVTSAANALGVQRFDLVGYEVDTESGSVTELSLARGVETLCQFTLAVGDADAPLADGEFAPPRAMEPGGSGDLGGVDSFDPGGFDQVAELRGMHRPVGPPPFFESEARDQIEHSVRAMLTTHDGASVPSVQDGEMLGSFLAEALRANPGTGPVLVRPLGVLFLSWREAVVWYDLSLGPLAPRMRPFEATVLLTNFGWKVARTSWTHLVELVGVAVPARPSDL